MTDKKVYGSPWEWLAELENRVEQLTEQVLRLNQRLRRFERPWENEEVQNCEV